MNNKIAEYLNGNCSVELFADGTKTRKYEGTPEPEFPESIDLKITDYCDAGCPHCFESSTIRGKHGETDQIIEIINSLHTGTEIAIGGGNPLEQPGLAHILQHCRNKGLICNLTINSKHILQWGSVIQYLRSNLLIKGLGISYDKSVDRMALADLIDNNTVIHLIAGVDDIRDFIHAKNAAIENDVKVLVLGYKEHGFGKRYYTIGDVEKKLKPWKYWIGDLMQMRSVSFDNLALEQLEIKNRVSAECWDKHYMGNDGHFTMFVDAVTDTYAVTSTQMRMPRYGKNITEMFQHVRKLAKA